MDILKNSIEQLSVLLVNVIFFLTVVSPLRLSRKLSGLITIIGFSLTIVPRMAFSDLFSPGTAATPDGLTFHFIYWILTMAIQYSLFFILIKRDWLHNILLYVIWDIIMTLFLFLFAIAIRIFWPQMHFQGILSFFCSIISAVFTALLLRQPFLKTIRLPENFCILIAFVYSIGRLVNTISLFRFDENSWQELVLYPVLILVVFLALMILLLNFSLNIYISRRCHNIENTYLRKKGKNINELFNNLGRICDQQHTQFYPLISSDTDFTDLNEKVLYSIELLFDLSREYTGRKSDNIFFSIQEHKGFLILSSCSDYQTASRNIRKKAVSLIKNTFFELLFNRVIKSCRGRVQYLDNTPLSKHIRVVIPLSLNTGA